MRLPNSHRRRVRVKPNNAEYNRKKTNSPALSLKYKPIWIPHTATASPFCGCVQANSTRAWKFTTSAPGKAVQVANALTFQADSRKAVEEAYPGDIIGLHNHGTIQVGDTFSQGETLKYGGIPYFAPELFRRVVLKDPLRAKALQKGLVQLTEEGATQLFRPLKNNDLILGAVGVLQFDVTAYRLKAEYNVECVYDAIPISTVRWVSSDKPAKLEEFKKKAFDNLAEDGGGYLVYVANSRVNLQLTEERWPDIKFSATREL